MSRDYEEMKSQDRHQDDGRNRHSDRLSSGRPRKAIPEIGIEKTVTGLAAGKKAGLKSN